MDPPGILMLTSIRKFFNLIGIRPESINFKKDEFNAETLMDAFQKEPKKCPVITAADWSEWFKNRTNPVFHNMITIGAMKGAESFPNNDLLTDLWFIKCKNSYRKNLTQPGMIQHKFVILTDQTLC